MWSWLNAYVERRNACPECGTFVGNSRWLFRNSLLLRWRCGECGCELRYSVPWRLGFGLLVAAAVIAYWEARPLPPGWRVPVLALAVLVFFVAALLLDRVVRAGR